MYPSIEIFGREAGTYGLMALLGLLACLFVGFFLIKRDDIDTFDFVLVLLAVFAGMAVGASIIYAVSNIKVIAYAFSHLGELGISGLWEYIVYSFGGMVFYGGYMGGAVAILIYTKCSKSLRPKRDALLDIYAVLVPLFHAFGRVGCFLGGCCYGVESAFGFTAHDNHLNPSVNDVNRFPIQLVESACNLIIFAVLLYLFCKHILEKRLIYVYMLTYPVVRFVTEFFRGDTYRGIFFGLSTSQWISIFLFVFALIMLPRKTAKMKAEREQKAPDELS